MARFARVLWMSLASALIFAACDEDPADDDDDASATDDDATGDDDSAAGQIAIDHTPPAGATEGQDVDLAAIVTDPNGVTETVAFYRNVGESEFRTAGLAAAGGDQWSGSLPGVTISSSGVEYYLQATGGSGTALWPEGAPADLQLLTAQNVAPQAPAPVRARYDHTGSVVDVTWAQPVSLDIASYEVFRSTDDHVDDTDTAVVSGDGTLLQAFDVDDKEGTLSVAYHWYAVRATDTFGEAIWSAGVQVDNLHLYDGFLGNPTPFPQANDGFFDLPTGADVDAGGQLFVADSLNGRIQVFSAAGVFSRKFGTAGSGEGQFNLPWDVSIDPGGTLWVAEYGGQRVQVVDAYGTFQLQVGTGIASEAEGGFWFPLSVAHDADGFAYVVDEHNPRVQKFGPDGTFVEAWTSAGATAFGAMGGITWSAEEGVLYVMDSGLDRVFTLDTAGAVLGETGGPGTGDGQFTEPHGLCATRWGDAITTDGDLLLAVPDSHRVSVFDPEGAFSWWFGGYGTQEAEFSVASDCAVAPDGTLWVVDRYNYRIHRYGP